MIFFYNIGIILYGLMIQIISLFNPKAKLWLSGRKNILDKITTTLQNENRPVIWFHCASLGEFEQGRPILDTIYQKYSEYAIVLTFFSPSGYEVRKNYKQADYIFYLPMDTVKNAKRFLAIVKPSIAVFVKYEFWLNYLNEITKQKIPAVLISAKFRYNQLFFKWYGRFYQKAIFAFEHIFVQDQTSYNLLKKINYPFVTVSGDTRFDRVVEIAKNPKEIPVLNQFTEEKFTIIAGSTWEKDEEIIANFFQKHQEKKLRLIIAPHEVYQKHLYQIKDLFKEPVLFYSQLIKKSQQTVTSRIILIDKIGLLSSVYQYGTIAYVGGGFGKGIHNILEPATFGLPVVFGPNYHKFNEATELIRHKGGFSVKDKYEFDSCIERLFTNEKLLKDTGTNSKFFVRDNCGAKQKILAYILNIQKKISTKKS